MPLCKIRSMHTYMFIDKAADLYPPLSFFPDRVYACTHTHTHTRVHTHCHSHILILIIPEESLTVRSCGYTSLFYGSHFLFLRGQLFIYWLLEVTKVFQNTT